MSLLGPYSLYYSFSRRTITPLLMSFLAGLVGLVGVVGTTAVLGGIVGYSIPLEVSDPRWDQDFNAKVGGSRQPKRIDPQSFGDAGLALRRRVIEQ